MRFCLIELSFDQPQSSLERLDLPIRLYGLVGNVTGCPVIGVFEFRNMLEIEICPRPLVIEIDGLVTHVRKSSKRQPEEQRNTEVGEGLSGKIELCEQFRIGLKCRFKADADNTHGIGMSDKQSTQLFCRIHIRRGGLRPVMDQQRLPLTPKKPLKFGVEAPLHHFVICDRKAESPPVELRKKAGCTLQAFRISAAGIRLVHHSFRSGSAPEECFAL